MTKQVASNSIACCVRAVLLLLFVLCPTFTLHAQAFSMLDTPITSIATGGHHSCALTTAGGVKCWGANDSGQLGDGTYVDRRLPVDVSALSSSVVAVTTGYGHACALTVAGGVKCWGANGYGQLGDSSAGTNRSTAVQVSGLSSGVAAITAGFGYTCALMTAGTVKCWGRNNLGQLGDATTTERHTPVDVLALGNDVIEIAAGEDGGHTCALTATGGVKCWGNNAAGQLGDGSLTDRHAPVDVSGLGSGITAIAVDGQHTCALTAAGGVTCWGNNQNGQLGDGTTTDRHTPVDVSGLASGVAAIAAGDSHTCALTAVGAVECWGAGLLEDGTDVLYTTPENMEFGNEIVAALAAGFAHTCALSLQGGVRCWGHNDDGQIGDGSTLTHPVPTAVYGFSAGVRTIAAGRQHTCMATPGGGAKCWGSNQFGQLGDGTSIDRHVPVDVPWPGWPGWFKLVGGLAHTCGMTAGRVKCWGNNDRGQLGDGTLVDHRLPADIVGPFYFAWEVSAGDYHTCMLTNSGGVKCWGENAHGELGDGTTTDRPMPVDVSGLTSGVAAIAAGGHHTCALSLTGAVQCWGSNQFGQLGDGTGITRHTPVGVSGLGSDVVAVTAGHNHTCALTVTGDVYCWGLNYDGQLGDGSTTDRHMPVAVTGLAREVEAIAAGDRFTCAKSVIGELQCWGDNFHGQLGNGDVVDRSTPVDVLGMSGGVGTIAAGANLACAVTSSYKLMCWGENTNGEVGNDSTIDQHEPVAIVDGQAITFAPPDALPIGASLTLQAAASGGGVVQFDVWTPDTCSLSGHTLSAIRTGLCGVRASQAGGSDGANGTLAAAPQQMRLIRIDYPPPWHPPANTLFSTGDFANGNSSCSAHPGNASLLDEASGAFRLGFNDDLLAGYRLAEDFTVPAGTIWFPVKAYFFAGQTDSGSISTIHHVNFRVWNTSPDTIGADVVCGNTSTNALIATANAGIFREASYNTGDCDRPLMVQTVDISGCPALGPGTYWIDWQTGGDASLDGPWVPPLAATPAGNALQLYPTLGWLKASDAGSGIQNGLPFVIAGFDLDVIFRNGFEQR